MEDIVRPFFTIFGGFVVDRVVDVVASFVVVSTGLAVVSVVVVLGKLVVVVTTAGMEVTTFVTLLVVVSGTDVVI